MRLPISLFGSRTDFWGSAELVREELFSPDRLNQHGASLAEAQPVSSRKQGGRQLSSRLRENAATLLQCYRSIARAVEDGRTITPAAEWIIDNYHIVEEQIFDIRGDLPPGYYRELPKLTAGPFAGLPRVFGLAWAYVAHTDSRFDPDLLCGFVEAYQRIQPLTIGELWAIPITLRFVLIENLRRAAERIVRSHNFRVEADAYADRILALGDTPAESIATVLALVDKPYPQTLIVQLAHRLRDPTPAVVPAVQWLEQQMTVEGRTVEAAVQAEHARQAGMNVTVRNVITSMRAISAMDWPDLFERMSLVDAKLRAATDFAAMDFPTRDIYRKHIEKMARQSEADELEVTAQVILLATAATERGAEPREREAGYYLIARGQATLEKAVGFRPSFRDRVRGLFRRFGVRGYIGLCISLALGVIAAIVAILSQHLTILPLIVFGLLAILPAIDLAATILSRVILAVAHPVALPALDLKEGVPPELRTMVVIPTLLSSHGSIEKVTGLLEVHYLSNASQDLTFALLSDWVDATEASIGTDEALLRQAKAGIDALNRRHPRSGDPRFLLLHRRRVWSKTQDCWLGWERKRGKLQELNRLLRGATDTTFIAIDGVAPKVPDGVRFVVTLDSDTRLPRDTVRHLVGKLAHVLNQPRIERERKLVTEGYGILQPRVTLALPHGSEGSWFQRVFSGAKGMDPYSAPVSDVYQDLFGEGSFLGKGIYDVDAFEAAMEGRTPENVILSHDLFEGIFARAGLAADIEIVEDFPRRYDVAASRQHRWARGDWQLLRWLLEPRRRPPAPASATLLGRWKMLDNLRRTLSAPVTVIALLGGWLLPPVASLIWCAFVLIALAAPAILPVVLGAFHVSPRSSWRGHFSMVFSDLYVATAQTGFVIATLVHQATLMLDAIVRTLWRLAVTGKRLLEWTTAEQAARKAEMNLTGFYRWMMMSVVVAVGGAIAAFATAPITGLIALPFVLAWLAAPALAWEASRVRPIRAIAALGAADARSLRLIARRTWRYFETFVTAEENWLPPDNFQEAPPQPAIAHRTSPTNIGLYLLSIMAARDFGWLGLADATDRLERTLGTMRQMFRFRGHFYNWYGTRDLRPLDPQYVSSVDSGNLAGHLIALANACEAATRPVATPESMALGGIDDGVALVRESLAERVEPPGMIGTALDALAAAMKTATPDAAGLSSLEPLAAELVEAVPADGATENPVAVWAEATLATIRSHQRDEPSPPQPLVDRLTALAREARQLAMQMDFRFLMDPDRQLMSIGYITSESRRDSNCYDLLASEARLASFFAIAKSDAMTKHWFRLGRTTTAVEHSAALVSWSGSMFEYLMPSLVMQAPSGSLLDLTNRLIVRRQISYAANLGIPWGISESAYNARDLEFTYQYSNFGVPGLGLKRGLSSSTVIAPYASALASMVDPVAAARNYEALTAEGARGRFGYYEALDFTPARVPEGERVAMVHAYMAHHQGMSIVAIANVLFAGVARHRFHAEPIIAASELLLEERHPQTATATPVRADEVKGPADVRPAVNAPPRQFDTAHTTRPQSGLLSNTRYSVMVTNAGSGYSSWNNLAVTRWRDDATLDDWGSYVYLRDVHDRRVWSAGYQPTRVEPESYLATFSEDRVRIARRDRTVMTSLEIAVSAEDDAEVRRVSLTNIGGMEREIEVTSYAEVVLAHAAHDVAHAAFSKMFVQTEFVEQHGAILAHRRKRSPDDPDIWAAHFAVVDGDMAGNIEYETDRARFIGVGQDLRAPAALRGVPLSNTAGIVLDPVFSVRRRLVVRPGTTTRVSFWTMVGSSREAVLEQVLKYDDAAAFDRVGTLAWTHAQVQLRHIDLTSTEASLFQRLATCILFPEPRFRAPDHVLKNPAFEVRALWAQGISGDLPIVALRLDTVEDLDLARELVLAHEYLRLKRLSFDLVILNERGSSYAQDLQQSLEALARVQATRLHLADEGKAGRIFVLRNDLITAESRLAITVAARVIVVGSRGSLSVQLDRFAGSSHTLPPSPPVSRPFPGKAEPQPDDLEFSNGLGGFVDQGREYVVTLENGRRTPAPWINVVANPTFGFHAAADGASYTWSVNSRDNQITPWSNDPVINHSGETIYLRDDDTGELWGPTAHPYQHPRGTYRARHGRGYSRFEHTAADLAADLTMFVPLDDSVKIIRLRLRNLSDLPRRLSVSAYVEWVLGNSRSQSATTIVTEMSASGALLARNARNQTCPGRVAFLATGNAPVTWTGARTEFLGRHGSTAEPAALISGGSLSNRVGGGLDPCGAFVTPLALEPNGTREIVIVIGDAASADAADALAVKYRAADLDAVFASVAYYWDDVLGALTVMTPDRSMDVMLNGWLLYQTLACRMWGRSGFYQASGAFGFRDQLQDCLASMVAAPHLARAHILRAAARQFVEGDVQHWWLPTSGQGVRTRIADDVVWLAYAVAEYVRSTGDTAILDERLAYLEGPRLAANEHDAFFEPRVSEEGEALYAHVVKALERSMAVGDHGLPLMGSGDWNDGMNLVGAGGKGESVWLAWFLHHTLEAFAPIAEARGELSDAERWRVHAGLLAAAAERSAWDGAWYRRAFFDDGTPLGSAQNEECRIDSIAQSWAVISGGAAPERAREAMREAEHQLIRRDDRLALLFTPPFDKSAVEPGYIKGYPPGLRENGGQYTHGAIWMVIAEAMQGEGDKAWGLFHMINPILHAMNADDVARYKVEPYVVAADIYSAEGQLGRGGWTWYTGSAGWLYRAGVEWILGIRKEGDALRIDPCIPRSWPGFRASLRSGNARYHISVDNPDGVSAGVVRLTVDGFSAPCSPPLVALVDDGKEHQITVLIGHPRHLA